MTALARLADIVDRFNDTVGRGVRWLALGLVLVQFVVVVLRYVFGSSFIWMQESVIYTHATLFMLAIGYTLLHDGHVRVDVIYAGLPRRRQAWIELAGALVAILPFCLLVLWACWPYVSISWRMREGPMFPGGIPWLYLLKSLIPAMAVLLLLQGVSVACRAILVLGGRSDTLYPRKQVGEAHG